MARMALLGVMKNIKRVASLHPSIHAGTYKDRDRDIEVQAGRYGA